MMLIIIRQIMAPLLSLFILMLGNGLFTTLLTLRLHLAGASSIMIGVVAGAYYAGLACGSFRIEKFIIRVGHIRAFATFASGLAVISLLQGILILPWLWILLRLLGGFLTAGLFVVIESWLLIVSPLKTRGQILAFYMIALYGAQALGQFFIDIGDSHSLLPFTIAAMLSSLAVIPLAMTHVSSPQFDEPSGLSFKKLYKTSASGVIGCLGGGLILGAIYGLLPLFIAQKTNNVSQVASFTALVIFGGMALQYPIGRLSDYIERRIVLTTVCVANIVMAFLTCIAFYYPLAPIITIFLFGGMVFTIYPISISYACDNLETKDIVAGTQGLSLAYSIGAALGPLLAPVFIHLLGANGLFVYFIIISLLLSIFFIWRRTQTTSAPQEEPFVSVPQTTAIMAELDPRGED